MNAKAESAPDPRPPEVDESGVDLAQIRSMLDLTPAERLERVFGFARSLLSAREFGARTGSR